MKCKNATICIVEDDDSFRKSLKRLIKALGFNVIAFDSASSFLEQVPLHKPSCLVLDINLPQMDGFTLQQELITKHINTPIIFITGFKDNTRIARAMKKGAVGFLQKPFSAQELTHVIAQAIEIDHQLNSLTP